MFLVAAIIIITVTAIVSWLDYKFSPLEKMDSDYWSKNWQDDI